MIAISAVRTLVASALICATAAGCSGMPPTTAAPMSTPAMTTPSAATLLDAEFASLLRDYNDRNNLAIVAANAGDLTAWKTADTGVVLEGDLVFGLSGKHGTVSAFDFVPMRALADLRPDAGQRAIVGLVTSGPRGAATASLTGSGSVGQSAGGTASVTASPSSTMSDEGIVVFTQAAPGKPWLMRLHAGRPLSLPVAGASRAPTAAEQAAVTEVASTAVAYLAGGTDTKGFDLDSIPRERGVLRNPWSATSPQSSCSVDAGPYLAGIGERAVGVVEIHCRTVLHDKKGLSWKDDAARVWGNQSGKEINAYYAGTLVIEVGGDRPRVAWWGLRDGMSPDRLFAVAGL
ncbi:MAG TPA: hypothetical protein P5181_02345 [Dermatophilaceae bacterium]|nr:hypothetical protein [Dermatophilaceae bacterium]